MTNCSSETLCGRATNVEDEHQLAREYELRTKAGLTDCLKTPIPNNGPELFECAGCLDRAKRLRILRIVRPMIKVCLARHAESSSPTQIAENTEETSATVAQPLRSEPVDAEPDRTSTTVVAQPLTTTVDASDGTDGIWRQKIWDYLQRKQADSQTSIAGVFNISIHDIGRIVDHEWFERDNGLVRIAKAKESEVK